MRSWIGVCVFLLLPLMGAETPIKVETRNLVLAVDPGACRWSAQVKGSAMQLNDVHFLPGDDASGWTVTPSVNNNDTSSLGSFVTVTLRGKKADNWISSTRSPPARTTTTFWSAWAVRTIPASLPTSGTWTTLCRAMRGWEAPPRNGSVWEPGLSMRSITTFRGSPIWSLPRLYQWNQWSRTWTQATAS